MTEIEFKAWYPLAIMTIDPNWYKLRQNKLFYTLNDISWEIYCIFVAERV